MRVFNLQRDEWDDEEEREGWRSRGARAATHIGAELLGGTLYEVDPGNRLFPYHLHHANEEVLVVLAGTPTVRTPEDERVLSPGDTAVFRRGAEGAHQIRNDSEEPVRYLMVSTLVSPDVAEYPDSGKVGAMARPPGERNRPGLVAVFPLDAAVDYFEGER